jgi:D-alanyl-D-alanine carboxypeptidase
MRSRACQLNLLQRAALALIGCVPPGAWAGPALTVPVPVTEVIAAQRLPPSAVSFVILDADSGHLVLGQNPDTPRSPASTIKTLTTFAALDLLGPSFTWHTRASIRGELGDGTLDGDLILQGGGDPYMTLERWWGFAHALRARGLKTIHGDIVIDNTAFSLPPEDPGEFDGRPNRAYNVLPDALMVNFQSIEFRVVPDAAARRIDIVAGHRQCGALRRRPLRRRGRQGRFQSGLGTLGSRGVQRGIVAALRRTQLYPGIAAAAHLCLRHLRRTVA